jgi:hypothetical protein
MMGPIAANDPKPVILLVPTDEDARGIAVDEVEPSSRPRLPCTGSLRRAATTVAIPLTRKALAGAASIKILSARAPRKLRRDRRTLLIDEADAMEVTTEGASISIPKSAPLRRPAGRSLLGRHPRKKASASSSGSIPSQISECTKPQLRHANSGAKQALDRREWSLACNAAEIGNHRGYRVNALDSLLANATWP